MNEKLKYKFSQGKPTKVMTKKLGKWNELIYNLKMCFLKKKLIEKEEKRRK